ncbi:hypothetical protein EDD16DRAFT_1592761 [Pisolithus croceorrhizus]|nr:hypothetical protein EDD16DRAFT_1592761 [Pisolithus croceorrhizus]
MTSAPIMYTPFQVLALSFVRGRAWARASGNTLRALRCIGSCQKHNGYVHQCPLLCAPPRQALGPSYPHTRGYPSSPNPAHKTKTSRDDKTPAAPRTPEVRQQASPRVHHLKEVGKVNAIRQTAILCLTNVSSSTPTEDVQNILQGTKSKVADLDSTHTACALLFSVPLR